MQRSLEKAKLSTVCSNCVKLICGLRDREGMKKAIVSRHNEIGERIRTKAVLIPSQTEERTQTRQMQLHGHVV